MNLVKKLIFKILNLKLVILLEYRNVFAKGCAPNWSEKVFVVKKQFIFEKVIKRKGDKLYTQLKYYDSSFNSWIDKKDSIK